MTINHYIDRVKNLREDKKAIEADIATVLKEAKSEGFDKAILSKVVNYLMKRELDAVAVDETDALFETYLSAYRNDPRNSGAYNERACAGAGEFTQ